MEQTHSRQPPRILSLVALVCLVLGLGLMDRGFTKWRNDARNFPRADGVYPTAQDLPPEARAHISGSGRFKLLMVTGLAAFVASIVLFGVAPLARSIDAK